MADERMEFEKRFKKLTGNCPLSWQIRLYDEFVENMITSVIDLPTGMGKTMVMAIWLIAREKNLSLPRRLVYVVDRRTVVDQATDIATTLQLGDKDKGTIGVGKDNLAISTLRGQKADDRAWSRDPSTAAIIIGTVDLIGSGLLFSGYRSSFKERPLHAGLLGQDSLLVLDEAHLSKPFEKLIKSIGCDGLFQKDHDGKPQGSPMKVIRMSATTSGNNDPRFTLEAADFIGDRETNIIIRRFEAEKHLHREAPLDKKQMNDKIAAKAAELAKNNARVVVFVQKPDDAIAIRNIIIKKDKTFESSVEVLTGTMRGLERDKLLKQPVLQRFLDGKEIFENRPASLAILVSTSAGEVGFDLNADHMVCDASPLDSMIQRLGRVNRRGDGIKETAALIHIFIAKAEEDKKKKEEFKKEKASHTYESASTMAWECLAELPKHEDASLDCSPKATQELREKPELLEKLKTAFTPPIVTVELTDILLDAWSMTSIIEPMPGRPEAAPWIRGIADELPQTTIAWRAELDINGFDKLDLDDIEEWLDTHRVLTHETLSVPTNVAGKRLIDRWEKLSDAQKTEVGSRPIIIDRAGLKLIKVKEVINQLARNTDAIRNADLILPASFGGIERGQGLLDADAPEVPKNENQKPFEEQRDAAKARSIATDVADVSERYRELITKTEDGEPEKSPIGSGTKPADIKIFTRLIIDLDSDDDKRVQLVSYVLKREKPEWGSKLQSLTEHVGLVRKCANEIIQRLGLPPDNPFRLALELAANFHDHGKNRERWQRLVDGVVTPAGQPWAEGTLGKSGGKMKRDPRGYRHEFGSLREFIDTPKDKKFADAKGNDITQEVFDLALHLIAVHHGRGRPHFPKGGFDPDAESRSPEIHTDSIRRFARLQRNYGHWRLAWLENLLRCADALASAEDKPSATPPPEEATGNGEMS